MLHFLLSLGRKMRLTLSLAFLVAVVMPVLCLMLATPSGRQLQRDDDIGMF